MAPALIATRPKGPGPDDPGPAVQPNDYAKLILAGDRERFYATYPLDIRPTTDDRPFFFHTTKLKDQTSVAFGRAMLFGNGLSALIEDLHERWGRQCIPIQLPISDAQGFHGVVDLVTMEAFHYTPNGDGHGKITGEIPASMAQQAWFRRDSKRSRDMRAKFARSGRKSSEAGRVWRR